VQEVEEDIPISDPTTQPEAEIEERAETAPESEPEKPTKQVVNAPIQAETGQDGTETGDVDVQAASGGTALSGATVDNASFNYPYWFQQSFNKIARNFRMPFAYDGTIVCAVYFQVIKSGRVIDIEIRESSGIPRFDEACKAAVERSAPFPPLPSEFRDEIIGITLPFKWNPR
jgi:protein TonB